MSRHPRADRDAVVLRCAAGKASNLSIARICKAKSSFSPVKSAGSIVS
jgi:hypothetical protein